MKSRFVFTLSLVTLSSVVLSCSEPPQKPGVLSDSAQGATTTTTTATATAANQTAVTAAPAANLGLSLYTQKEINKLLCTRLQTLKNQCRAGARLRDDGNVSLSCDGSSGSVPLTTTFEAIVDDGGSGNQYKLSVNDGAFLSDVIPSGTKTKIKWTPQGSLAASAPRLADLDSMRVVTASGSSSGAVLTRAVLFVNGGDPVVQGSGIHVGDKLPIDKLRDDMRSDVCRVGPSEVDALVAQARDNAQKAVAANPQLAVLTADQSATASASVSSEQEQTLRFTKELTNDANLGCWMQQKMDKVELTVSGSLFDQPRPGEWEMPYPAGSAEGDPNVMNIDVGSDIKLSKGDAVPSLSGGSFTISTTEFAGKTIAALGDLKIGKPGNAFESRRSGDKWIHFNIRQVNLQSITLKVNDQTVFSVNGLNTALVYGQQQQVGYDPSSGLNDERFRISSNDAYQKLRNRSDCPVVQ